MDKLLQLVEQGEQELADTDARASELLSQAHSKRDEASHELQAKLDLEQALQALQVDVRGHKNTLLEREHLMQSEEENIINTENQLRESKAAMENIINTENQLRESK